MQGWTLRAIGKEIMGLMGYCMSYEYRGDVENDEWSGFYGMLMTQV